MQDQQQQVTTTTPSLSFAHTMHTQLLVNQKSLVELSYLIQQVQQQRKLLQLEQNSMAAEKLKEANKRVLDQEEEIAAHLRDKSDKNLYILELKKTNAQLQGDMAKQKQSMDECNKVVKELQQDKQKLEQAYQQQEDREMCMQREMNLLRQDCIFLQHALWQKVQSNW